jgi:hypothetical protein
MVFYLLPTGVFIAQGLDPTSLPQSARLAANLASMEGFLLGGFEAVRGTAHPEMYTFEQLSTLLQGMVTVRETPVKRSRVNGGNAPSSPPDRFTSLF